MIRWWKGGNGFRSYRSSFRPNEIWVQIFVSYTYVCGLFTQLLVISSFTQVPVSCNRRSLTINIFFVLRFSLYSCTYCQACVHLLRLQISRHSFLFWGGGRFLHFGLLRVELSECPLVQISHTCTWEMMQVVLVHTVDCYWSISQVGTYTYPAIIGLSM
ncbi:hypothetical protein V8F33_001743 [Rhypophila sp. PSN 637]